MKKAATILVLMVMIIAGGGYHCYYNLLISAAKKEMKISLRSGFGKQQLSEIEFTPGDFESLDWEDGHEFLWKGHMYDMVNISRSTGKITITCIADKKETGLLNAFLNSQKQQSKDTEMVIGKIMSTSFLLPSIFVLKAHFCNLQKQYGTYSDFYSSHQLTVFTPPPEGC